MCLREPEGGARGCGVLAHLSGNARLSTVGYAPSEASCKGDALSHNVGYRMCEMAVVCNFVKEW